MEENKKNGIINKLFNLFKKQGEVEKDKKARKEQSKKNKPKGQSARIAGNIVFWILFSFMLLFVFVNMFAKKNPIDIDSLLVQESKITSHEAVDFAHEFVHDMFVYGTDKDISEKRLEKYLAKDVSPSDLIRIGNSEAKVNLDRANITTKDVYKINETKSRITVSVLFETVTPLDDKQVEKYEEEPNEFLIELHKEKGYEIDKYDPNNNIQVSKGNVIEKGELQLNVPVSLTESGGFVIYDFPSFAYQSNEEEKVFENLYADLKSVTDTKTVDNITNFLSGTFFKNFTTESPDGLRYYLQDEFYKYGLNETVNYVNIGDTDVYEGKGDDFIVRTNVTFTKMNELLQFNSTYLLVLVEVDDRYVVTHVNDETYIEEFLKGEEEAEDEETNENENSEDTNENEDGTNENSNDTNEENTDLPKDIEEAYSLLVRSVEDKDLEDFNNLLGGDLKSNAEKVLTGFLGVNEDDFEKESSKIMEELFDEEDDVDEALIGKIETFDDLVTFVVFEELNSAFTNEGEGFEGLISYDDFELETNANEHKLTHKEQSDAHLIFTEEENGFKLTDHHLMFVNLADGVEMKTKK